MVRMGISARMLREAAPAISASLTNLFNFSLQSGTLPMEWKSAHVIPIFKKGPKISRQELSSYLPYKSACRDRGKTDIQSHFWIY